MVAIEIYHVVADMVLLLLLLLLLYIQKNYKLPKPDLYASFFIPFFGPANMPPSFSFMLPYVNNHKNSMLAE